MIEVLHITPHLGGGVGKALACLTEAMYRSGVPVRHTYACLEVPEKNQFANSIRDSGGRLVIQPSRDALNQLINSTDIVQLEWWNHPATIETLCSFPVLTSRLLIWCHQSGLINPVIPAGLIEAAGRFVATSPCSLDAKNVRQSLAYSQGRISVISSGAGCEALPPPPERKPDISVSMSTGYLGSLNFSKLHPEYAVWMAAVDDPDFKVRLIGDEVNRATLERQCMALGHPGILQFAGYTSDVTGELARMDVMAYLLNPRHYGTAENALIEAMGMGVVPVVLDNAAEKAIVSNGQTGLVVSSKQEFVEAMRFLKESPGERISIGQRASADVRKRFTAERMAGEFMSEYTSLMDSPTVSVEFRQIFGDLPHQWFLACQEEDSVFRGVGGLPGKPGVVIPHDAFELSKGSVCQFSRYFPYDPVIREWSQHIQ